MVGGGHRAGVLHPRRTQLVAAVYLRDTRSLFNVVRSLGGHPAVSLPPCHHGQLGAEGSYAAVLPRLQVVRADNVLYTLASQLPGLRAGVTLAQHSVGFLEFYNRIPSCIP